MAVTTAKVTRLLLRTTSSLKPDSQLRHKKCNLISIADGKGVKFAANFHNNFASFFPDAVVDDDVVVEVVVDVAVVELHFGRLFVVPRLRERKITFSSSSQKIH